MIFKLSELRVVAFTKFAPESEKTIVTVDIEYQKHIAHSVTRWLSLYPIACQGSVAYLEYRRHGTFHGRHFDGRRKNWQKFKNENLYLQFRESLFCTPCTHKL